MKTSGKCILNIPFEEITDDEVSLADVTPCKYRLVECRSFEERKNLRIFEFEKLPTRKYGAISYVWRGLEPKDNPPKITVAGTGGTGVMSVEVLRIACKALRKRKCEFLWLDGLCIIQGSTADKNWQMERMYEIYKLCAQCLVIPGGLLRLAELTEETTWAHRAWTLQEAFAPPSSECLFAWKYGDCFLQTNAETAVIEIEKEVAAVADMKNLLGTSLKGSYLVTKTHEDCGERHKLWHGTEVKILGQHSQVEALIGALDLKEDEQEGMENAIWRSSFMRTAKYPVDNVFSIMGLMGVTLDTSKFGREDRLKATIAMMQKILERGHRAEWLGLATKMKVNPALSTIPAFPKSSGGKAIVITSEGETEAFNVMDGWWMIANTPGGSMDDEGYLELTVPAASIREVQSEKIDIGFKAVNKSRWEVLPTRQGSAYALFIGTKTFYNSGHLSKMVDLDDMVLMLVEQNSYGKFRNIGYAFIPKEMAEGEAWSEQTFKVGGPSWRT